MKKVFLFCSLVAFAFALYSFQASNTPPSAATSSDAFSNHHFAGKINWMTWDEAVAANQKTGKKIFIDFYTDWCGWCKKMDASTFSDEKVAQYINENFYPVKFNAEQKEDIVFMGTTFKYQNAGRRGAHALAVELLNGQMSYPSYVYLTPGYERILISPGYKPVPNMLKELTFVADDHYKTTSWDDFKMNGE